jgi:CheY-like chemotaxis protein
VTDVAGQKSALTTILVVDDEPLIRLDICAALNERGYRTVAAFDGTEALRIARDSHPALVVTDIYMEGGDGLSLISALRRDGDAIPIIALSGASDKYDVLGIAKRMGATATLEKPFIIYEIVRAVEGLLGREGVD